MTEMYSNLESDETPSGVYIELRPIYELDENYVYTGKSMAYYKDVEKTEVNEPLFERWTASVPPWGPLTIKYHREIKTINYLRVKKEHQKKLNNLDTTINWEPVAEE